jgi:hypothetical protein
MVALVAASGSASAEAVHWRFTTGFDYSTGRYQQPVSTIVLLTPLAARAYYGNWTFRIATNLLDIHGPANVAIIDDRNGDVNSSVGAVPGDNRRGFGDTTVAVNYTRAHLFDSAFYADVGARLRIPTGNYDQGLGSGAVDEIVNLELGANWKTYGAYVSGGRRFLGDSHGFARKDGYQFGFGGWYSVAPHWEVGTYYEYRNSVMVTLPDPKNIGLYVTHYLASEWKLELDVSKGLSSGAATNDVGLYLTYRPDGGYR